MWEIFRQSLKYIEYTNKNNIEEVELLHDHYYPNE